MFKKQIVLSAFILVITPHIFGQTISLISPNGNEQWEANSTRTIIWESENITNVKIEYSLNNGYSWLTIVASFDAYSGEYLWTTADAKTPYTLIRVSDASNPAINASSTENFSLVKDDPTKLLTTAIRIMPLGDSITEGVNPDYEDSTSSSPGYRRFLDSLLISSGYAFDFIGSLSWGDPPDFDQDHEGHGGWNAFTTGFAGDKSLLDSLKKFLTNNPPDIILLHIGTNDLGGQDALGLANEVKNLLDTIYTFNPSITTIIAKIIDRADTELRHIRTENFNNTELPNMISALSPSQQEKIILVDMYNALGTYWNNFSNSNFTYQAGSNLHMLHPNTNGYKNMANVWFDSLITILPSPTVLADTKIFLEGPYSSGAMSTALNSGGYLPLSQPYNIPPWNYSGLENVSPGFFSAHNSIVDWLLLELRDSSDSTLIVSRRTAFLLNNGSVVDTDGVNPVSFSDILPGSYYLAINHRNHLPVMSSGTISLNQFKPDSAYDFTTGSNKFFGSTAGAKEIESTVWGMIAGDTDINYAVGSSDLINCRAELGTSNYNINDINLNGTVELSDLIIVRPNLGKAIQLP